jgi:hypothetical protein
MAHDKRRRIMSSSLKKLVLSALFAVLMLGVLATCGSPAPTPQVVIATNTFTPQVAIVTATFTPQVVIATNTFTPQVAIVTATFTPTPPSTEPLPTPIPTGTPAPEAPSATIQPSDTPIPETPTSTPQPATNTPKPPTKTPQDEYPPPTLLAPEEKDAGSLHGQVTFRWSYPKQLASGEAFQVLIWKVDQPHWGAAELWTGTQQTINLDVVLPQRGGNGEYFWTVVVRELGTEKLLSPEAPPWRLTYSPPQDVCAACDCNQDCKQGSCEDCCFTCCGGCD